MKNPWLTPAHVRAITALIVDHKDMLGFADCTPEEIAARAHPIYEALATAIPAYVAIAVSGSGEAPVAVQRLVALDPFVKLFNSISNGTFKAQPVN